MPLLGLAYKGICETDGIFGVQIIKHFIGTKIFLIFLYMEVHLDFPNCCYILLHKGVYFVFVFVFLGQRT